MNSLEHPTHDYPAHDYSAHALQKPRSSAPHLSHLRLGASLYVPCTHPNLLEIARGDKLPGVRSLIFCLEDSISETQLERALKALESVLGQLEPRPGCLRFVRVRNPEVLRWVLGMEGVDLLDGFVLPKISTLTLGSYLLALPEHSGFWLMPTLETREVFEETRMLELRAALEGVKHQVLSLRIGGNDLLNLLGLRRLRGKTLYQTPLSSVVARLVSIFKPHGYNLSAPVYDIAHDPATLSFETRLDLEHGLFGKTAIHPSQIAPIELEYQVDPLELRVAEATLQDGAPAVFLLEDHMCEVATHRNWALEVCSRAEIYGVRG